jgi:hypothetical protein
MYCPLCDGESEFLGQLGNLEWYRCRYCGAEFSVKTEDDEARIEDVKED